MKKNIGTIDRTIRIVAALVVAVLLLTGSIQGTLGIVLGIIALALLVTSAFAFCPGYLPFKISTKREAPPSA